MKKLIIIMISLAMFFIPFSSVMADKGGVPNGNADGGQSVSEGARDGDMGGYGRGGKALSNIGDLNGDGKVNGKDFTDKAKNFFDWLKDKMTKNDEDEEDEE